MHPLLGGIRDYSQKIKVARSHFGVVKYGTIRAHNKFATVHEMYVMRLCLIISFLEYKTNSQISGGYLGTQTLNNCFEFLEPKKKHNNIPEAGIIKLYANRDKNIRQWCPFIFRNT
jgi:hypothetical protein